MAFDEPGTERLGESAQRCGIGPVDVQMQAAPAFRRLLDLLEGQLRRSGAGGLSQTNCS